LVLASGASLVLLGFGGFFMILVTSCVGDGCLALGALYISTGGALLVSGILVLRLGVILRNRERKR